MSSEESIMSESSEQIQTGKNIFLFTWSRMFQYRIIYTSQI